ncbi:IL5 [Acrasis kona]|uniref:IL5 n=1 Tax=Acrasis kona TaxID=1008807 RepID=A0AAW2YIF5_9EUKA
MDCKAKVTTTYYGKVDKEYRYMYLDRSVLHLLRSGKAYHLKAYLNTQHHYCTPFVACAFLWELDNSKTGITRKPTVTEIFDKFKNVPLSQIRKQIPETFVIQEQDVGRERRICKYFLDYTFNKKYGEKTTKRVLVDLFSIVQASKGDPEDDDGEPFFDFGLCDSTFLTTKTSPTLKLLSNENFISDELKQAMRFHGYTHPRVVFISDLKFEIPAALNIPLSHPNIYKRTNGLVSFLFE